MKRNMWIGGKKMRWEKEYKYKGEIDIRYCCPKCKGNNITFQGMPTRNVSGRDYNELWWCNDCKHKELREVRYIFDNNNKNIANAVVKEMWSKYG